MTTKEYTTPLLPQRKSVDKTSGDKGDMIELRVYNAKPQNTALFESDIDLSSNSIKYSKKPSFFQWLTFSDMFPHIQQINKSKKGFEIDDVPKPEYQFNIGIKLLGLERHWVEELTKEKPSFSNTLIRSFRKEIIQAVVLAIIENSSKVFCSIYMGKIISVIEFNKSGQNINSEELVFSAAVLSMLVIISVFAKGWYYYIMTATFGQMRLTTSALIYKKLNSTSLTSLHEINIGKVINLIANDLMGLKDIFWIPSMLITPYLIGLGAYLMWEYFGLSCLIGLGLLPLVIVCQVFLSRLTEIPRKDNKKATDQRIKCTHEVIESIRLIKMYTWDRFFKEKLSTLREKEYKSFMKMNQLEAASINISNLSVYFVILVVCIVYICLDGILSAEKVYATMMILLCLSNSLIACHSGSMGLTNLKIIMDRVKEVLLVKDVVRKKESIINISNKSSQDPCSVIFKNFTGYWSQTASTPCLSNINLICHQRTLTAVIGKVGAGKSTLLLSILKELASSNGTLTFSGTVAYVEQDPIIFSGTLRENILFGKEYDESLYQKTLRDCNLEEDLQKFSYGDLTRIGERGVNLSGGQKARLSLARALYSQSDIYLLDDPFSALDSKVARDIFDKVLKGDLAKRRTVILVTHHLNFARESDHIVLMNEGRIEAQGTFEDLEKLNISLLSVFKASVTEKLEKEEKGQEKEKQDKNVQVSTLKSKEKESKEKNAEVTWNTYKDYLKTKGSWQAFVLVITIFLVSHGLIVLYSRFIGQWAEEQSRFYESHEIADGETFNNSYYVLVSVVMLILIFILNYIKTVKMFEFFISANSDLHQRMLDSLMRAKILFFDLNPVGRILNRFSSDLGILDKNNIKTTFEFIDNGVSYITLLLTICFVNPVMLLPILVVTYGLIQTKKFFEKTLVIVKPLELTTKGPMVSAVSATLQGLIIIRVYQQGARFIKDFMNLAYNSIKIFIFMEKTIRLFGFVLEISIQLLSIFGVWIFVFLLVYYQVEAGLLGLCLMYLLKISEQGSILVRHIIWIDVNMQSAERMLEYSRLESESPEDIPEEDSRVKNEFHGRWPIKGEIELSQVYLKYRTDLNFALNGLSLKIPGGLKIACVGRTGAGKSSIIQALYRMTEIDKGPNHQNSFIKIDGVNIGSIGLNLLRSKLSIIPQTPVVFANTIKKNLDPFEELSTNELWAILEEVGLKENIKNLPNQLETDMAAGSSTFSTGQKQLVCLARAIIKKSKIIILDEATANVDVETDSLIQKIILKKFDDCTVITIAHRLITIANYDKVAVIDGGSVVEYDSPYMLLVEKNGDSEITMKTGIFVDMVKSSGPSMAKNIFECARAHFYKGRG